MKNIKDLLLPLFIILFFSPLSAQAYLDPGSGSIVIQVIIAIIAGISFALKTYWHKIKSFFGRSKSDSVPTDDVKKEEEKHDNNQEQQTD